MNIANIVLPTISLWQPWASAIALGLKNYETRHWKTNLRGRIAIHAARTKTGNQKDIFDELMSRGDFADPMNNARLFSFSMLPMGAIVATARLVEIIPTETLTQNGDLPVLERLLGDYARGRFAWKLTDIKPLDQPYYVRGHQGIFNTDLTHLNLSL